MNKIKHDRRKIRKKGNRRDERRQELKKQRMRE